MSKIVIHQDPQVTVRLLPDGDPCAAMLDKIEGRFLSIAFTEGPGPVAVNPGDLVEITCPATLYLGVVRMRSELKASVVIEHALDRETLATIQQVWHGRAGK